MKSLSFLLEDSHAGFDIWWLQLRGQTPFEARYEALFEVGNLACGTIAGEHDLFTAIEEGIEGVKKLFLRALFSCEEVDIVDEQDVGLAITFTELDECIMLNCVDKFVRKFFAR